MAINDGTATQVDCSPSPGSLTGTNVLEFDCLGVLSNKVSIRQVVAGVLTLKLRRVSIFEGAVNCSWFVSSMTNLQGGAPMSSLFTPDASCGAMTFSIVETYDFVTLVQGTGTGELSFAPLTSTPAGTYPLTV